ncbi:hypothetical protein CBS147343_4749 [Aspergillus niger]|nr:hypothetical protein CBS133816_1887 [Aspergillus niger]KAI2899709.1 hypothetical protein CBS11852_3276 [Aspergillus niger]KAI2918076.1 hypothetical protein CBS147371_4368 [Aspergillus niger]KAI2928919.1 hypothetical protein CBS147320_4177 [Aspergillus niger]KAI2941633.1 hypothetical protein CBS147321_5780 [Aspergillus niger]
MASTASVKAREIWLDGLRGIAAAIVAWFHFTVAEMKAPYRSFWAVPAAENHRFFQLPPFRLLFAGQSMVLLFFVISGYAVSTSIIRLRDDAPAQFYRKLTSSVFRRGFRLYIPVLTLCLISHSAYYMGLIDWMPGDREGCPGAQPWSALRPHLSCLTMTFLTTLHLSGPFYVTGYNFHLWTISYEYQCSMAVYLVILGLASIRPRVRLLAIAGLCVTLMWFGSPILSAFMAGLLFAELDILREASWNLLAAGEIRKQTILLRNCANVFTSFLFVSGIYLLCLPQDTSFPPDFRFQSSLELPFYVDPEIRIRGWHAVGAILVVGTLRRVRFLRVSLETRLVQFLGTISFSLYLFHPLFIMVMRNRILQAVCSHLWGTDFWHTQQDESAWHVLFLAWTAAAVVMFPLLILASMYMSKTVDRKSVVWAYQVENLVSRASR